MFGRRASRKSRARSSQTRLPDIYIWLNQGVGGNTLRLFVPRTEVDLVIDLPDLQRIVADQLDEAYYQLVGVRSYAAYVAVQWRWTPDVEQPQEVERLLVGIEQLALSMLSTSLGLTEDPMVARLHSLQDVTRTARERGMGNGWLLGGS